ncbi:MAG: CDP-diacylglycerol--glycerol-3-phosphate 3-phosphatidyltransferase [Candidatus Limiplasma sp.]|nr:CDP-diacylglycerol--glycerol-3-phosphate 3-phosphatidyltransferase [Candidatus Limiplasma sp.]MEA5146156.1 CDP-diacylglycerol--glycerol-3-phosphate 3-phosphatidyltransferase [Candidatus Limiplasma sp.]
MNWPNRITIARVALIPLIVILLQFEAPIFQGLALIAFMIASLTDWLDGYIARRFQIVTNFGKFLDPVADKLLVLSTMIALCGLGRFPAWVCVVVLFRELAVDGLRLVAVEQGRVIAAGKLGKIKTTLQMITLTLALLDTRMFGSFPITEIFMYAAVAMTLWSGIDYFVRNGAVLSGGGKTR